MMNIWQTCYVPSSILSYTQVIHVKPLRARYHHCPHLQMKRLRSCVSRSHSSAEAAGLVSVFTCGALQLPRPGDGALRKRSLSREPETTTGRQQGHAPQPEGTAYPWGRVACLGLDQGQAMQAEHGEKGAAGRKEAWNRSQGTDHTEAGGSVVRRLGGTFLKEEVIKGF